MRENEVGVKRTRRSGRRTRGRSSGRASTALRRPPSSTRRCLFTPLALPSGPGAVAPLVRCQLAVLAHWCWAAVVCKAAAACRKARLSRARRQVLSDAQQLVIDQQHEIEQAKARIAKLRLKSTLHGGPGQAGGPAGGQGQAA